MERERVMVTFRSHHGHDGQAPLIDGFEVVRDEKVVGFIYPDGGFLRSYPCAGWVEDRDAQLTKAEMSAVREKGAQVRKLPSEYGWIGVGEPPSDTVSR